MPSYFASPVMNVTDPGICGHLIVADRRRIIIVQSFRGAP